MSSFWFMLKQQWTIEEIFIFSNSSHLEWRVELSSTIMKWDYPRTNPAKFGLIWFSGFREEDLKMIFIKICPICIICINRWTKNSTEKLGLYGRNCWKRPWIKRRNVFGAYHALLEELRREDPNSYTKCVLHLFCGCKANARCSPCF